MRLSVFLNQSVVVLKQDKSQDSLTRVFVLFSYLLFEVKDDSFFENLANKNLVITLVALIKKIDSLSKGYIFSILKSLNDRTKGQSKVTSEALKQFAELKIQEIEKLFPFKQ